MANPAEEIFAVAEIRPHDAQNQDLFDAVEVLAVATRAEDGCLRYDVFQSTDGTGNIVILEVWQDAEALRLHGETDHIAAFKLVARGHSDVTVKTFPN